MKFRLIFLMIQVAGLTTACQKEFDSLPDEFTESDESTLKSAEGKNSGYVHGIKVDIDGELYYFAGAPDGEDGAIDVPSHPWFRQEKIEQSANITILGHLGWKNGGHRMHLMVRCYTR